MTLSKQASHKNLSLSPSVLEAYFVLDLAESGRGREDCVRPGEPSHEDL
jgi:hypothetical protein